MPQYRTQVRAARDFASHTLKVYRFFGNEEAGIVQPEWAAIQDAEAQQLMDDLYRMGFRPTEGKVTDRTLEAQSENLKDLRSIIDRVLPHALKK